MSSLVHTQHFQAAPHPRLPLLQIRIHALLGSFDSSVQWSIFISFYFQFVPVPAVAYSDFNISFKMYVLFKSEFKYQCYQNNLTITVKHL